MNEPRPDREPVASPDDAAPDPVETHRDALKRLPKEIGGPKGPEPTRFGDWERNGRCTDF
jgi:hypothetical protein